MELLGWGYAYLIDVAKLPFREPVLKAHSTEYILTSLQAQMQY